MTRLESKMLPNDYDTLAPDGSQIRLLQSLDGVSVVHCRLPPGAVTVPVRHRTVAEIWYILAGEGEIWRKLDDEEETLPLSAGISLTIPLGAHFQFRTIGDAPLDFIIATSPPWPGEDEAILLEMGRWDT